MCLRFVGVVLEALLVWCSSSTAFLLVPLPPPAFLVYGLPLLPRIFYFFSLFRLCAFYLHWASGLSVTGAIAGVAGCGGGLVAGLQVGRPVGVLPPWGVIVVTAP